MSSCTSTSKDSDSERPIVAVFDFDGTLTSQDSLMPFLRFLAGSLDYSTGLLAIAPTLFGYKLNLIPNWQAKERVLTHFLGGQSLEKLTQVAQHFAAEKIPQLIRPEALARLRWHQAQQHQTLIVSASLELYLSVWGKQAGFDQVVGTRLAICDGLISGKLLGDNCYGIEKVCRLEAVIGELKQYCIYAYGDSQGDRELLKVADFSYYRPFRRSSR